MKKQNVSQKHMAYNITHLATAPSEKRTLLLLNVFFCGFFICFGFWQLDFRGVLFRTESIILDGAFCEKKTAFNIHFVKNSVLGISLGFEWACARYSN